MSPEASAGKLFYIVGASGSGKDSILRQVMAVLIESDFPALTACRYITRENTSLNQQKENFISLSEKEFVARQSYGCFALDWQANDCRYGIGIEVDQWLAKGLSVVVNGSRSYLPVAKENYPQQLISIEIEVPESVLLERLRSRKREDETQIQQRMQRHQRLKTELVTDSKVNNSGSIEAAVEELATIIMKG